MWKRNSHLKSNGSFLVSFEFLGVAGKLLKFPLNFFGIFGADETPILNCWCQPGWEGLVRFWPDVPGRRRSSGTGAAGRKKWNEAWKTTWDGWVIWLLSAWRHPNCDVQTPFFLWGCLGYRCKNVQFGRWVEVKIYFSQLFAWSPPCLELFLPPKTSLCMMCTGSDPLPTSELGDPLGNNIYIYTQSEFLSSTYPRYRYIFMVYSVVNEILVIFVMCFLRRSKFVSDLFPTGRQP